MKQSNSFASSKTKIILFMKPKLICSIILFLAVTSVAMAQKDTSFSSATTTLERNFKLEKDSKTEEVTVDIPQNSPRFELKVGSSVSSGKLTIEVYDPKGVKLGNYTVGLQANSEKETTGRITKYFKQPLAGAWKIKIIPEQATGQVWSEFLIYE